MPEGPDTTGRATGYDQQWVLTLVPTFPVLLLLLRLWYLSRQNLQTMLLLVQNVSPLGLISTLLITLVWTPPLIVLVGRTLGALYQVSSRPDEAAAPGLVRAGLRIPNWVVALSVLLAGLTWQLRFLPALLMVTVALLGLQVRLRLPDRPRLVRTICVALPLTTAVATYAWLAPAIAQALAEGQGATLMLLVLPPALAVLLTGPVPARAARSLTSAVALIAVLFAPFLVGAIFLKAPVLPTIAMEIDADPHDNVPPEVAIGYVISVNDRMTTLLSRQGDVRFVPNEQVASQTLCADNEQIPTVPVSLRGWQVEQPMLAWIAPVRRSTASDPRCAGRPLGRS